MLQWQQAGEFVIEACTREVTAEKAGCVSFTTPHPHLVAEEFIIAAQNVAPYFSRHAGRISHNPNLPVFTEFVPALHATNKGKSAKIINFGILEILFPTLYACITADTVDRIPDSIGELLERHENADVDAILRARIVAWQTSRKPAKKTFPIQQYGNLPSVAAVYNAFVRDYPESSAQAQWGRQYQQGFPVLREYLAALREQPWKPAIEQAYATMRSRDPTIKVGILADMAAAALFIDLVAKKI